MCSSIHAKVVFFKPKGNISCAWSKGLCPCSGRGEAVLRDLPLFDHWLSSPLLFTASLMLSTWIYQPTQPTSLLTVWHSYTVIRSKKEIHLLECLSPGLILSLMTSNLRKSEVIWGQDSHLIDTSCAFWHHKENCAIKLWWHLEINSIRSNFLYTVNYAVESSLWMV